MIKYKHYNASYLMEIGLVIFKYSEPKGHVSYNEARYKIVQKESTPTKLSNASRN